MTLVGWPGGVGGGLEVVLLVVIPPGTDFLQTKYFLFPQIFIFSP